MSFHVVTCTYKCILGANHFLHLCFEMILNNYFFLSSGACHHGGGSWQRSPLCCRSQTRNRGAEVNEVQKKNCREPWRTLLKQQTSHHNCMPRIVFLSFFCPPLVFYGSLLPGFLSCVPSSYSGWGWPHFVSAAISDKWCVNVKTFAMKRTLNSNFVIHMKI